MLSSAADVVDSHAARISEGKLQCRLCRHETRDKYNMRRHLEGVHHLTNGYPCPRCGETLRNQLALSRHKLGGCQSLIA